MAKTASLKPLSRMKNPLKGEIHHVEIHPAKNSKGKMGFITKTFRKPSKAEQAQADAQGRYLPDATEEQPNTAHEDGNDMLDHVGNTMGIPPENDGDADDGEEAA